MLLRITDADKASRIVGHPRQDGQLCRYDEATTKALIEAGCAEVHESEKPKQAEHFEGDPEKLQAKAKRTRKAKG